jgi:CDP-diacylglycerol--inositol 3-phosphatidyltransferase
MGKKATTNDVLLFYPNLIGYGRFIFMVLAFATSTWNWKVSVVCYLLAFVGDVVDGHVARACNQCKCSELSDDLS